MKISEINEKSNLSSPSNNCHHFVFRYDSTTGIFTVPPGGDGVYYFSTHLLGQDYEFAYFDMRLNGDNICSTFLDQNDNGAGDAAAGSCSAVVDVVAGDVYIK